jgi:hypothetical protein
MRAQLLIRIVTPLVPYLTRYVETSSSQESFDVATALNQ